MGCAFPIKMMIRGRLVTARCRNCANCRAERKGGTDIRFNLELLENYKKGYGATFLTLTYDDDHLPIIARPIEFGGVELQSSLKKQDALDFKNKLKDHAKRAEKAGEHIVGNFAYVMAGEYGDEGRPHYHLAIIGLTAEQTAALSKKIWNKGMLRSEVLKGTQGISYITDYFSTAINGPKRKEIFDKYGFEAPFLTKSCRAGEEYIMKNIDKFKENGLTIMSNGQRIPLPRAIRDRFKELEGIKYQPSTNKLQKTVLEANQRGFKDVEDYQQWKNWIKEYSLIQKSRMKGNGEKSTYTLFNAIDSSYHIQGEDEI